jgi:hypothetical protein
MEYNKLISIENYKLLSIRTFQNYIKFKKSLLGAYFMKGLCQKCHSSNVEITLEDGSPICEKCAKK